MELVFRTVASVAALCLEALVVILVCIGAIETLQGIFQYVLGRGDARFNRRLIWMRFARWLVLALEFALAADIIRTAIAPTWTEIGQLAVIATVRTVLGYFLERDIASFGDPETRNELPTDIRTPPRPSRDAP